MWVYINGKLIKLKDNKIEATSPYLGNQSSGLSGYNEFLNPTPITKEQAEKIIAKKNAMFDDPSSSNNGLSIFNGFGSKIASAVSGIGSAVGESKGYGSVNDGAETIKSGLYSGVETIGNMIAPGAGTITSAALGLVDGLGKAGGISLNTPDKDSAERADINDTWINEVSEYIPAASAVAGVFGKRTHDFNAPDNINHMVAGYSGTAKDINAAKNLANQRMFSWQADSANNFMNSAQINAVDTATIDKTGTTLRKSDYSQDISNQLYNRYNDVYRTKQGGVLMSAEDARRILAARKESDGPGKFQNGGNIPGIDSSLLPSGSLHKERHHLEDVNPDLEDATKKGIPVMSAAAGGEIQEEVAEIERDEWIMSLSLTKQIEELKQDGSEEAMLEAGKLIAAEIIENTVDNTGQITGENGDTDSDNKQ